MKILVTGSTGFIGQHLVNGLVSAGHEVVACRRKTARRSLLPSGASPLELEFSQLLSVADWLPFLTDIEAVINCVGIIAELKSHTFTRIHDQSPSALFRACEQAGVARVIQISALGAETDQPVRYYATKAAADEVVKSLRLHWTIFKPSVVYGSGAKSMALFKALALMPIVPLIGDGHQKIQPVHIDDLVAAIVICLQQQPPLNQVIDAVGPEAISFIRLIQKLGHWFGKDQLYTLAIPPKFFKMFASLGHWINEPALSRESIEMLLQENSADSRPFSDYLGYSPKTIDQSLQQSLPTQADRWHARLYLMRPLLNFSIALVWLWAGWVSAFVYPIESSYQILDQAGIARSFAPLVLYGASAIDCALGIAMLLRWKLRWIIFIQLAIMAIYTVVISFALTEYWAEPFGPVVKNIPLAVATLILLILEEERP